jgi:putative heme iron utilization protein
MGTGIYYFEGSAGADGRSIVQTCKYDNSLESVVEWRSVTRLVDDNSYAVEMYGTDPSGKERKIMEDTYTRK